MINARTKLALAAKARAVKLGTRSSPRHVRKLWRQAADNHAANVLPIIRDIRKAGTTTLRGRLPMP